MMWCLLYQIIKGNERVKTRENSTMGCHLSPQSEPLQELIKLEGGGGEALNIISVGK